MSVKIKTTVRRSEEYQIDVAISDLVKRGWVLLKKDKFTDQGFGAKVGWMAVLIKESN